MALTVSRAMILLPIAAWMRDLEHLPRNELFIFADQIVGRAGTRCRGGR